MQRLLRRADWDVDAVRDDVRDYVIEHLGDPQGVLIIDDTGFLKKGVKSAGVARQYSGTAGRIENCQVGVFMAYRSSRGHALIDRQLYLPQAWTDDRQRCRQAGIPDEVEFATKVEMARTMLTRAFAAGIPVGWVTLEEAYGQSKSLRVWMEDHDQPHVVATRRNDDVITTSMGSRAVVENGPATVRACRELAEAELLQGRILVSLSDPEAVSAIERAIGLFRQVSDRAAVLRAELELAGALVELHGVSDLVPAERLYERIEGDVGEADVDRAAQLCAGMARLRVAQYRQEMAAGWGRRNEAAAQLLSSALELQQKRLGLLRTEADADLADTHYEVGRILAEGGRHRDAAMQYLKASRVYARRGERRALGRVSLSMAHAAAQDGDRDNALHFAREAEMHFLRLSEPAPREVAEARAFLRKLSEDSR
jgi:tetratricopeptide (TPR) repeat protein